VLGQDEASDPDFLWRQFHKRGLGFAFREIFPFFFFQNEVAATIRNRQSEELDRLMNDKQLSKYAVNGNEDVWKNELKTISEPGIISIPR